MTDTTFISKPPLTSPLHGLVAETPRGNYQRDRLNEDGTVTKHHTTDLIVKITGHRLLVTHFPVHTVDIFSTKGRKRKTTDTPQPVRRSDSIKRAQQTVKDIMFCNYPLIPKRYLAPVSITLTYKDKQGHTLEYRDQALRDYAQFMRLLRRKYGKELKTETVIELQKRGVIHFHLMVFNMPYNLMQDVIAMWPHCEPQGIHIRRQKYGKRGARQYAEKYSSYITTGNYYSKELGEYCEKGEKSHLPSKGLLHPETSTDPFFTYEILKTCLLNEKYILVNVTHKEKHPFYEVPCSYQEYEIP